MVLERSYWVAVGVSSYIGLAGLQNSGLTPVALGALVMGPALLWEVWRQTRQRGERAQLAPEQVWATRLAVAAAVGWLQARIAGGPNLLLEVAASVCLAVLAIAALFCLARIPSSPGLIDPPKSARSLDAAAFVGSLWAAVLVLAVARFIDTHNRWALDPLTLDYTNTAASVGTLLVFTAASWRVATTRKLELGISDRANGALVLSLCSLGVAIPAALVNIGPPDRVLPAAVVVAACCVVWTALTSDPSKIARALRATLAILFLCAPVVLVLGGLAESNPEQSPLLVLLATVAATGIGLVAQVLARPLGPARSRWLLAVERASQDVLVPEPNTAIVATLSALKTAFRSPKISPQLWRVNPPACLSVDVAGYLAEQPVKVPAKVYELALQEPEHTLRQETLAALQVKRADVRGLLDWFNVRGAFSATAIVEGEDAVGFLLMPREQRKAPLSLEEAKALHALAERLSGVLAVTASLARSRQQELRAVQDAERARAETARLTAVLSGSAYRHQVFARQLARPVLSTAYSVAARNAVAALEKWPPPPQPHVLMCPPGVDANPWAAVAHLANRQGAGPLLLLDGSESSAATKAMWQASEHSPAALTHGGTLFIRDADLLPPEHQQVLVESLTSSALQSNSALQSSSAPGTEESSTGVPSFRVVLSFRQGPSNGMPPTIIPALNALLPTSVLRLPSLHERPEDLRALVLDCLGRQRPGEALGIDRHALQALLDYEWPGNEAQLRDVLDRAAMKCKGAQLRLSDLQASGFIMPSTASSPSEAVSATPASESEKDTPLPRRRRARTYRGRSPGS